jgi:hypothetical protein
MSFQPGAGLEKHALDGVLRALEKRWVQALLFIATFLAAWLHDVRIAHASWLGF